VTPPLRIHSDIVGTTAGPRVHEIDARWLMAYAAALGDAAPEYLDTLRPAGIIGHPLFPVCYEWPLALDLRAKTFGDDVALRSVHATHDLVIHRRVRPGDQLATTATITLVEPRRPGAFVVTRFDTVDHREAPVSTTHYGSLYLRVGCEGQTALTHVDASPAPVLDAARGAWEETVEVGATLAHVYTEGARIWNPVHTDPAAARAAGLPQIILHGTATLALAVSAALRRSGAGPGAPVRRITGRFGGMVLMPSTLTVRGAGAASTPAGRWIGFAVLRGEARAVRDGRLLLGTETRGDR
jgi:acyl dehydratase